MQRYARNQQRLKESRSSEVFIKKSTSNSTNKSSTKFNVSIENDAVLKKRTTFELILLFLSS